ncbi:MAG: hypothetical protein GC179_24130 [Anaerolineaceae bacterium]|nr:hypothetical protein [Anaerolineaceae bacterium]
MRNFQLLDVVTYDKHAGSIQFTSEEPLAAKPYVTVQREGGYVAFSASYGPLEIAVRPRFQELSRVLGRLNAVEGLQTTRQIGTAQAYLAVGLKPDGLLLLRPTVVGDATGHIGLNLALSSPARQAFFEWLPAGVET